MKKFLILLVVLVLAMAWILPMSVFAATTADVIVTAQPSYIGITVSYSGSPAAYDFGVVAASATPSTTTAYFTIDNVSTVATDQSIGIKTSANWSGGSPTWSVAEDGTPGTNISGMLARVGGTWGATATPIDVVVHYTTPDLIADNQAASTDYSFGLKLLVPTSFGTITDPAQKTITVVVSAAAAA